MSLQHLWPAMKAEIIQAELEELAKNFEGAGPQATWTGEQIAWHIRERIKNHPATGLITGHQ
jgi:hypothetical protein